MMEVLHSILWISVTIYWVNGDQGNRDKPTATIGIVDIPGMMNFSGEALAQCIHKEYIELDPLPQVHGQNVLQQAEILKRNMANSSYYAVIGPSSETVVMVTENLDIPFLMTDNSYYGAAQNVYSILPEYDDIVKCVLAIVNFYQWKAVGILWENNSGARVLTGFLESSHIDIRLFRIHENETVIRDALRSIRNLGIKNILLMTSPQTTRRVLDSGKRLGIVAVPYSWLILHHGIMADLDSFLEELHTNVTVVHIMQDWTKEELLSPRVQEIGLLRAHATKQAIHMLCTMMKPEYIGMKFTEVLQESYYKGIQFDDRGKRINFSWDIYCRTDSLFKKIALWNKGETSSELKILTPENDTSLEPWPSNKITVVSILEKPWIMLKKGKNKSCRGNDCFEGFIVDMMRKIASLTMFRSPGMEYELYIVPDGLFGSKDPETGEWNGIMGEIMSGHANMSLAPLSINKQREEAVDFTKPFKTRGISVLIKTPESQSSFFQFLDPLSYKVWGAILVAMTAVGIALGIYERHGTSQRKDMVKVTGQESCWFVIGTLMQEGTEAAPVTIAGRILTGAWWFFAMILISSYTANLAAFLTVKKINTPIETVSDLVGQTKIKYGTVRDSGVLEFFRNTQVEPFRTMYERMGPENLVDNTTEGKKRVQEGNYAFLWDNTVTSYIAATDCNFTEIGPGFDPKGFGIGVPTSARYRENLTLAILSLADTGFINELEARWWADGKCHTGGQSNSAEETEELQLENVAGIFFVLVGGLILGLIACITDKYCICLRKVFQGKYPFQNRNSDPRPCSPGDNTMKLALPPGKDKDTNDHHPLNMPEIDSKVHLQVHLDQENLDVNSELPEKNYNERTHNHPNAFKYPRGTTPAAFTKTPKSHTEPIVDRYGHTKF